MRQTKVLFVGLILAVGLVGYLAMKQTKRTTERVDDLAVAAGDIEYAGSGEVDLASPEPFVHCYAVDGPDAMEMSMRLDFEARTTKGWVVAPDEGAEGEYCLIESESAIAKRLDEQRESRE